MYKEEVGSDRYSACAGGCSDASEPPSEIVFAVEATATYCHQFARQVESVPGTPAACPSSQDTISTCAAASCVPGEDSVSQVCDLPCVPKHSDCGNLGCGVVRECQTGMCSALGYCTDCAALGAPCPNGDECGLTACAGVCGDRVNDDPEDACPGDGMICNWDLGRCEPCTPNCPGSCGDDGCGGVCGVCNDNERCEGNPPSCQPTCTPACAGLTCGPDGCGGLCGSCPAGNFCSLGVCVPESTGGGSTGANACLDTSATHPTGGGNCVGEVVGYFTNLCSVDMECTICPAYGPTLSEYWPEKCHLVDLTAADTDGGERSGNWWCGIADQFWGWRFICSFK